MKRLIVVLMMGMLIFSSALVWAAPAVPPSQMKIFYIVKASESEFWQIVLDGADKAAKHFGVELIAQSATSESDVARQVSILETAIGMEPDAIVIAPTVADALVPGIEQAMDAGIPVIIIDSAANTDKYVAYLASDNYKIGQIAADEMAKALEKKFGKAEGKVAGVTFMSGVGSLEARKAGFLDRIEEKYPDIQVLEFKDAQGKQGNTLAITQDVLTGNPDLKGIFANNQYTGDEVVRALDMAGRKDLAVVVVDSGPQELWGLENGYVDGMIVQKPWNMGYAGLVYGILGRNQVPVAKDIDTGVVVISPEMLETGEADEFLKPIEFHKDW
ncbi:MAG: ABC transporter substrate-binding protein [Atribacterota bacterium]|jgi:ribose transport system substrate-binding protein|nr:ABC transporter substrate-binding protein [Atribacterota bacterium]MDI9607633.1 ABC transporter substrate-binding protein [Atribacterota bacterium]HOQ50859.1 ABC transporter substrate-binding protein [Candidatus Atribacteria bacterium]